MNKTLSVSAIQNGTVIDHIPAGQALRILHLLRLLNKKCQVTVGFNLSSQRMKLKDLVKVENYLLTKEEADKITVFAPDATINIIKNFDVVEKIITQLPPGIEGVFSCPNQACISHVEPVESFFIIKEQSKRVHVICKYCEKIFDRNQVKVKI
ncbi:aspartate carbamoyltransferase regulatory subunit [Aquicella lusitana]|jgi:aspartate carbamoyltransferase, regulatory subunit|uniref:Aspartate carbamoyltransferase regulatory chain n=1 Tax=Aquicella lusitana TaxID=254246 RepID=A0A370GDL5_9COXI|nr:aspartate carbamoyltransferase regulatory subunit [Aquicella lusitana]RDI41306.1 aspartate carbamoyltransferase regulatory subunit [Aquicella lusitana]VVC72327.1 Aspartate carbamoyltransferase regulatory chain [Aquicella lusitana]